MLVGPKLLNLRATVRPKLDPKAEIPGSTVLERKTLRPMAALFCPQASNFVAALAPVANRDRRLGDPAEFQPAQLRNWPQEVPVDGEPKPNEVSLISLLGSAGVKVPMMLTVEIGKYFQALQALDQGLLGHALGRLFEGGNAFYLNQIIDGLTTEELRGFVKLMGPTYQPKLSLADYDPFSRVILGLTTDELNDLFRGLSPSQKSSFLAKADFGNAAAGQRISAVPGFNLLIRKLDPANILALLTEAQESDLVLLVRDLAPEILNEFIVQLLLGNQSSAPHFSALQRLVPTISRYYRT